MENWTIFILGLVLGIPLSIFANVATPWVKSYFENRLLTTKGRKIKYLTDEYKIMKELKESDSKLTNWYLRKVITMLFGVVSLITISVLLLSSPMVGDNIFTWSFLVGILAIYVLTYQIYNQTINVRRDISNFDKFKQKALEKLIKLGGNPDDLDKE